MFKVKNQRKDGGLKQTLKGKPAPCHPDKVVWARGMCKNCYNKWLKENNPDYANRQKKNVTEWMDKHRKHRKSYMSDWRAKQDPLYNRIRLLRQYGMTIDDYDDMLKKQKGVCAICGKHPKKGKNFHVDHDHDTGHVRGLLCFRCNFGLSYFDGSRKMVENLYWYLKGDKNELRRPK